MILVHELSVREAWIEIIYLRHVAPEDICRLP